MAESEPVSPVEVVQQDPLKPLANESSVSIVNTAAPHLIQSMPIWQTKIWGRVALGLGICCFLLICLVAFSVYSTATIISNKSGVDLGFTFAGITLLNTTLLRLLAMLIGSGVIFGGLAISFFSSKDPNRISLQAIPASGEKFKAMVASNTPGVVGVFIGGVIIIAALFAKGQYEYRTPERYIFSPAATQNLNGNSSASGEISDIPSVEEARSAQNETPTTTTDAGAANEK